MSARPDLSLVNKRRLHKTANPKLLQLESPLKQMPHNATARGDVGSVFPTGNLSDFASFKRMNVL